MADIYDDALQGVGQSKAEKRRYKRQQKLLKKYGIRLNLIERVMVVNTKTIEN